MNTSLVIALTIGVVCGILIGSRVAHRSQKEQPVYGGEMAKALHWLACAAFTGGVPAGLVDIFLGRNVVAGILLAMGFVGVSFLALVAYGIAERSPRARAEAEDRGWTAEKARSSGL